MNIRLVGRLVAIVLIIEAAFMTVPVLIGAIDGERNVMFSFGLTIAIIAAVCALLLLICRSRDTSERGFYTQEGFVTTGLSWLAMSFFGCLPFVISGQIPSVIDAWFETVSGFTTTGASILTEVEPLSRGMLYWRSFTHWLGGMGVLVFMMAIIPAASKKKNSDVFLLRAESPGPTVDKFTPHMRSTAMILYVIYIALTVACVLFLRFLGDMPWFDAVCTAYGTAGTGGFGTKNDSITSYSPAAQNITTVFMLLFGVNFNLYYLAVLGRLRAIFRNEEFRAYLLIWTGATAIVVVNIMDMFGSFAEALRHAAFQTSSIMTTTGFGTTDFEQWPTLSKTVLLLLMCIGASAGSTGGGMKVARVLLLGKSLRRGVRRALHPNRSVSVSMDGTAVSDSTLDNLNAYFVAYAAIIVMSILAISVDGKSMTTNISAVVACFNNIGPGFEVVGATGNYSSFSVFSKLVLSADMLLGRLEIFPLLVMLSRSAWDRRL